MKPRSERKRGKKSKTQSDGIVKGKGRYEFLHSFIPFSILAFSFFTFSSHWGFTSEFHFQYSNSLGCVSLFRYRKSFRAKKVYFISLAKSSYLQYKLGKIYTGCPIIPVRPAVMASVYLCINWSDKYYVIRKKMSKNTKTWSSYSYHREEKFSTEIALQNKSQKLYTFLWMKSGKN